MTEQIVRYNYIHGASKKGPNKLLYQAWVTMRQRCGNPRGKHYKNYGGRGIDVCSRWHDFQNFLDDMGERPSPKHTVERIDNDKGYWCGHPACPECGSFWREPNCRWATMKEQMNNQRKTVRLSLDGVTRTMKEWAVVLGVSYKLLRGRHDAGWDDRRILVQPKGVRWLWRGRKVCSLEGMP